MKTTIHWVAALTAAVCITLFLIATIWVEFFGPRELIPVVKSHIVTPGLFILVPAIAVTGATGFSLVRRRKGPLVKAKIRRMPIIGANGILILVPAAILLDRWAAVGSYDARFYIVQLAELIAGGTNLILMILNLLDGLRLSGRIRPSRRRSNPGQTSR